MIDDTDTNPSDKWEIDKGNITNFTQLEGSGRMYKGLLKNQTTVAIKAFTRSTDGEREFKDTSDIMKMFHHPNLVQVTRYFV